MHPIWDTKNRTNCVEVVGFHCVHTVWVLPASQWLPSVVLHMYFRCSRVFFLQIILYCPDSLWYVAKRIHSTSSYWQEVPCLWMYYHPKSDSRLLGKPSATKSVTFFLLLLLWFIFCFTSHIFQKEKKNMLTVFLLFHFHFLCIDCAYAMLSLI